MTVEFDCEGCGDHVWAVGSDTVPEHRMCCVCDWLCEWVRDPEEIVKLRKELRHE
jgi:hypothetical protein